MVAELIKRLIEREGGYVNHSRDRGGPTKYGITQRTLSKWRGRWVQVRKVEELTIEEAAQIYEMTYWIKPRLGTVSRSDIVDEILFDSAVHHGPDRTVKLLQRSISVKDDGVLGPITMKFARRLDPKNLAALFMSERVTFLGEIITDDPSQAVFAHGWMRRMSEFIVSIPLA